MVDFRNTKESSFNIFFFISLVLHGILFLTFPYWNSILVSDVIGADHGGVFRIVMSDFEPSRELSPIADPTSDTITPQVEQAKPTSEPPISLADATKVIPEETGSIVPPVKTRPEAVDTFRQEQQETKISEPEIEQESGESQLLTGDTGREIVIDSQEESEIVHESDEEQKSPEPEEDESVEGEEGTPEGDVVEGDDVEEMGLSGTGDHPIGEFDSGVDPVQESGHGDAEIALQPPQLPGGSGLFSRPGGLGYPKDAQHDRVEGSVELDVSVDPQGVVRDVIITKSSSDMRLDEFARQVVTKIGLAENVKEEIILTGEKIVISLTMDFTIVDGNYESYINEAVKVRFAEDD